MLVRPNGHVAWEGDGTLDKEKARRVMGAILGWETHSGHVTRDGNEENDEDAGGLGLLGLMGAGGGGGGGAS